jgi:uncharacterized protein
MDVFLSVTSAVVGDVLTTFWRVLPWLALGVLGAAALSVYVGPEVISRLLNRRTTTASAAAVGAAVLTPFCSCGTTAVVLSMIATTAPWAPIVAFMVASPLTSPGEVFVSAGLFGWSFAIVFLVGTSLIGIAAGAVAAGAERLGLLSNQARFTPRAPACGAQGAPCGTEPTPISLSTETRFAAFGSNQTVVARPPRLEAFLGGPKLRAFGRETITLGRRILLYFFGFATIGYLIVEVMPQQWITSLLGGDSVVSTFIAATAGIPLYITTEGSLPLVAGLMDGGMGSGPAMAFLVTGAGTSIAALSGALLIARWRVISIVVGSLWLGGILLGLIAGVLL